MDFIIRTFCRDDAERIIAHVVNHREPAEVYTDSSVTVTAFPLKHRVPCVGYRFDEAPKQRHLNREMADFYGIPVAYFGLLKQGKDFELEDGTVIPNDRVTTSPRAPFSYAYCSDTAYLPSVIDVIKGVDLLYHETTYAAEMSARAKVTMHSTTHDAARIASDAEVGHLLIGHYSARYASKAMVQLLLEETQSLFPRVIAAEDGLTLDFEDLRGRL